MHIVIRSSKHDSSTTYTLGRDFDKLLTLKEFDTVAKKDGQKEGPDANPRFSKTLDVPIG